MLRGYGEVHYGGTRRAEVLYYIEEGPEGKQVKGTLRPAPGSPANWERVEDPVNERLTLSLECGCDFGFFVEGRSLGNQVVVEVRGKRRRPAGVPPHEHS